MKAILAALALAAATIAAQAESLGYCHRKPEASAAELSRALRVAAVLRSVLDTERPAAALLSRSGQDLSRFGERLSHAGIVLAAPGAAPVVRQLYFACDERESRLFDEGLAAFVVGSGGAGGTKPALLSLVLLDADDAARLAERARDNALALAVLGRSYSAAAYAFADRHQNCNQWVAEMLAVAWGALEPGAALRPRAQQWLREAGYEPARLQLPSRWLLALPIVVPWLRDDDHPREDLDALVLRVSLPAAIESFVQRRSAAARRIQICHDEQRIVLRRGWLPLAADCAPEPGDEVMPLSE